MTENTIKCNDIQNTIEEFRAEGDGMEVYVGIWEENIAVEDMDEAVASYALKLKMTEVDATAEKDALEILNSIKK